MNPENLTMLDISISKGYAYATEREKELRALMMEGMTLHGIIKNAYQEGFLAGFTYRLTGGNDD